MTLRRPLVAPAAVAGATSVLSLATLVGAWHEDRGISAFLAGNHATGWLVGFAFGLVGALVLHHRPTNRLGLVLAAVGLCAATSTAAVEYTAYALDSRPRAVPGGPLAAAMEVLWLPAFLLLLVALPLLFPNGRLPSPRWRVPAAGAGVSGAVAVAGLATVDAEVSDATGGAYRNPLDLPLPDGPQLAVTMVAFVVTIGVGVVAVVGILLRLRHAGPTERRQNAWFVAAVVLALSSGLLSLPDAAAFAMNVLAVAAIAIGIVRHQLFDIEVVLSRTLVYAVLTAVALVAYLLAAVSLGVSLDAGVGPALVAAVTALLLAGARHRVQQAVDRLLYGRRSDPLAALASFGDRLAQALDADAVLPAIVDTVRTTLRLPYAAVRLADEETAAYASGPAPSDTVEFPLAYAGERVGVLVVGPRRGEQALSIEDRLLLEAFARQAGVAAHGVQVTRDLRRSRERVIVAREEERLRIRRDLHDGVGPALAGITLGLETAARRVEQDALAAATLLARLRDECASCVEEIRRIVADLRPPALDQGGLIDALRRHADVLNASAETPVVLVENESEPLPSLPAAVEVAAYRIALEAMTNAVRHSGGRTCRVWVSHRDGLRITVHDDGTGEAPGAVGLGLASMRERAEELGGWCRVTFRQGHGTRMEAVLPVVAR